MKKVVIIGAGGFGQETLDVFEHQANPDEYEVLGFIVQAQYAKPGEIVHGLPVLGDFDWLEKHSKEVYAVCSLGAPHQRRRMVEMAQKAGARFCPAVIHRQTTPDHIERGTTLGEDVIIHGLNQISSRIQIGNHMHLTGTLIGHNTILENYVTVSPGCLIGGDVTIEEGAFIGMGAIIIQDLTIGAWSVGAGATVISNVPANTTVVGVPAKVVQTRPEGWQNCVE